MHCIFLCTVLYNRVDQIGHFFSRQQIQKVNDELNGNVFNVCYLRFSTSKSLPLNGYSPTKAVMFKLHKLLLMKHRKFKELIYCKYCM